MRIYARKYQGGDEYIHETSANGESVLKELAGTRKPGAPVEAFIEVYCDDSDEGFKQLEITLAFLKHLATDRRSSLSNAPAGTASP